MNDISLPSFIENGNKEIIARLVKNHFSLSFSSQKKFEKLLFEGPELLSPYDEIFENAKDYRVYFPLFDEKLLLFDESFKHFKRALHFFYFNNIHSYESFLEGKITYKGNKMSLTKAAYRFYENNIRYFIYDFKVTDSMVAKTGNGSEKMLSDFALSSEDYNNKKKFVFNLEKFLSTSLESGIVFLTPKQNKLMFKSIIADMIRFATFKKTSLRKNNLRLVISKNFADYFLASTAENWDSCLSLFSDYNYGAGLPGLITDVNRSMIYVSDGTTKNYRDIIVHKKNFRSWLISLEEDKLGYVLGYPEDMLDLSLVSEKISYDVVKLQDRKKDWKSKYSFPLLYFNNGKSAFIYQDNTEFKVDPWNSEHVFIRSGRSGMHYLDENNSFNSGDIFVVEQLSLDDIISDHDAIENWEVEDKIYCHSCGRAIREDESIEHEGDFYCERCFHENFATCDHCGITEEIDFMYTTEDGSRILCESCYNEMYTTCERCGNEVRHEDTITHNLSTYCFDCYVEIKEEEREEEHSLQLAFNL